MKAAQLMAVLALVALAMTGCDTGNTTANATTNAVADSAPKGDILIGSIMPLSGDAAAYGIPMQQVAEFGRLLSGEGQGRDGLGGTFFFMMQICVKHSSSPYLSITENICWFF